MLNITTIASIIMLVVFIFTTYPIYLFFNKRVDDNLLLLTTTIEYVDIKE